MGLPNGIRVILRLLLANRAALIAENLALRQQFAVVSRTAKRTRRRQRDRIFWVWISKLWRDWRSALVVVQPDTVVRWHRRGFKLRRRPSPPSQTWRSFLKNHMNCTAACDFFVVPTVTFRLLYCFVILAHGRRRIVHFNVTACSTCAFGCGGSSSESPAARRWSRSDWKPTPP